MKIMPKKSKSVLIAKLIDYNKTVLIMLEFLGGQYQVVSISDLPK